MPAAKRAAMRYAQHGPGSATQDLQRGATARSAVLASRDHFWTLAVKHTCGPRLVERTIVVALHFPVAVHKFHSASLSSATVFVSRFPRHRYRVWWQFH